MKAVGIISEYNPFHEGHAYHIEQAKKLSGADFAVVIMNGDFVQRGEPAIIDKYTRTTQALRGGADLVFELPVRFGISSAGDFAYGGILALEKLGFVDSVCFGSECGDLTLLEKVADILHDEPSDFKFFLDNFLRQGMSYPTARSLALTETNDISTDLLKEPNNILAIEYLIALKQIKSSIRPITIQRIGQDYHGKQDVQGFLSATTKRKKIIETNKPNVVLEDFSSIMGYRILSTPDLSRFKDISPDLAERIQKNMKNYYSLTTLIRQCSNPSITTGRIRRGLLQCMLNIEYTDKSMPYLRLLGIKKEASSLLNKPEDTSCLILSKLSADCRKLSEDAHLLFQQDLFASDIYRQVFSNKYHQMLPNEFQHSPIVFD